MRYKRGACIPSTTGRVWVMDKAGGGSMSSNVRSSNGNARRKLRRWLKDQGYPCAICGAPINYSLPVTHPMSFEMDEVVPVSKHWLHLYNEQQGCWAGPYASGQAAAVAQENVQATHRKCNIKKSNKVVILNDDLPIARSRTY